MRTCEELEPLFAGYVDGEGSSDQRTMVEAHLERCPPCRTTVTAQRAVRDALGARRERLRGCASEHLRARCAAQRAAAPVGRVAAALPGWRMLVPLSLAATVLLAVGAVFLYSAVNQVEALAAQLAIDHMKCAQFGSAHVDPASAAAEWTRTYGWPLAVPPSAPDRGLEFVTVRRCLVTEGRTAHMMYTWRGQPLSVFVVPTAIEGAQAQRIVRSFGQDAVIWSSGGRTYVVVAQGRRDDEMEPVVTYVRARAR
jgi:anti-sigma factor RsiW